MKPMYLQVVYSLAVLHLTQENASFKRKLVFFLTAFYFHQVPGSSALAAAAAGGTCGAHSAPSACSVNMKIYLPSLFLGSIFQYPPSLAITALGFVSTGADTCEIIELNSLNLTSAENLAISFVDFTHLRFAPLQLKRTLTVKQMLFCQL